MSNNEQIKENGITFNIIFTTLRALTYYGGRQKDLKRKKMTLRNLLMHPRKTGKKRLMLEISKKGFEFNLQWLNFSHSIASLFLFLHIFFNGAQEKKEFYLVETSYNFVFSCGLCDDALFFVLIDSLFTLAATIEFK